MAKYMLVGWRSKSELRDGQVSYSCQGNKYSKLGETGGRGGAWK